MRPVCGPGHPQTEGSPYPIASVTRSVTFITGQPPHAGPPKTDARGARRGAPLRTQTDHRRPPVATHPTLVSMLEALWVGQSDRHGGNLPPIPVTTEAAQAAVLMATTLVQWFQSGCRAARHDLTLGRATTWLSGLVVGPPSATFVCLGSRRWPATDQRRTSPSEGIGAHVSWRWLRRTTVDLRRCFSNPGSHSGL
jgi:hypothetical protein